MVAFDKPSDWGKRVPYHNIETSDQEKCIAAWRSENLLTASPWVVKEKVHGANFSFHTDGSKVVCARRSTVLADDDNFFNFQTVRDRYSANAVRLFEIVKERGLLRGVKVVVFGELYGGVYPGIEAVPGASPVQTEVQYRPDNDFVAFDVFDGTDFMDVTTMHEVLRAAEIPYLDPLFTGTFEEAVNFDANFQTTIPALLGLPPFPHGRTNTAEGIIIRPLCHLRASNGSRLILKIRADDFLERVKSTKKDRKRTERSRRERRGMTAATVMALSAIDEFLNLNRLASVISKEGPVNEGNKVTMMRLLYADAMEDLRKDDKLRELVDGLPETERKVVEKKGSSLAMQVVLQRLPL